MAPAKKGLEIEDAWPEDHRREWKVQRAVWVGMLLLLALAMAGFLSHGPLSRATAAAAAGGVEASATYEAWARYLDTDQLEVRVRGLGGASNVSVVLDPAFLATVEVRGVQPPADGAASSREGGVWTWQVEGEGPGELLFVFHLEHDAWGVFENVLRVRPDGGDGPALAMRRVVLP